MLLSICIPTYNRCDEVINLINFLLSEIEGKDFINDLEIIISDNCSIDETQEKVQNLTKGVSVISYHKNSENIGLIGNLYKLLELSQGDYVWFMGDDDIYHVGIVAHIINELKKNRCTYIFINHCAYSKYKGDGTGYMSAIPSLPKYTDKKSLLKIFDHTGPSLMFISANVYKRDVLLTCDFSSHDNLALPLYMSFYCASKGDVTIIPNILIENKWGEISWRGESRKIYYEYIPNILISLPRLGYNNFSVRLVMLKYRIGKTILYQKIRYVIKKMMFS